MFVACLFFFFKQKTAYEIKECDWSSDVCSSDLLSHTSNCVSSEDSVAPGPFSRAVMKLSGTPTTTHTPPGCPSENSLANTGRPSYASTPSWIDTCQAIFKA